MYDKTSWGIFIGCNEMTIHMLSQDEYLEIKEFLRYRVCEINRLENKYREKQREEENKYSLPNADSFGWMPVITRCYSINIGNNQIMYIIPYMPFYNFLSLILPQALNNCPNLFGTNDAKDVFSAVYHVSGFDKIGSIDDYQHYLIDNACCYFLLRNANGELSNKIFRLDLFRHILSNDKKGHDFVGGLMHAYRHCSWNGMKLSSGNGEIVLNSLWDLPLFIGGTILTDNESEQKNSITFEDDYRVWQIKYHTDPETGVYYLRTAFAKHKRFNTI